MIKIYLFLVLTISSQTLSAQSMITNYQSEGNLEPNEPAECVSINGLSNRQNPVDIFIGFNKCTSKESYSKAAELYITALSYGFYDKERVADSSAHQAIGVLRMGVVGALHENALNKLQRAISELASDNTTLCEKLRKLGPPSYHPTYMIQHGLGAFIGQKTKDGLVEKFDGETAWEESLVTVPKCATDTTIVVIPVNTYFVKDNQVWFKSHWGDKLVKEADAISFKPLSGGWGVDSKNVFYTDDLVLEADPLTFEVIDFSNGKDTKHVFRSGKMCEECDAKTFRALEFDWYKDKNNVYQRTSRLEDADPESFTILSDWFAKDKNFAYENTFKIVGADAESFKLKKCGTSKVSAEDKYKCYSGSEGLPCDCEAYQKYDFPFVKQPVPKNQSHINLVHQFKNKFKFKVLQVGDFQVKAQLNAYVPSGLQNVSYSCQKQGEDSSEILSLEYDLKPNRTYSIFAKENADVDCESEIRPLTWFEGQNDHQIQVSIKYLNSRNGRTNEVWSVATKLPEDLDSVTLVCRIINKHDLIHTERKIAFKAKKGHLYKGYGEPDSSGKECNAKIIDETLGTIAKN